MPDIEKDNLTRRFENIIPSRAQQFKEEYDDQFRDVLVEILGWGWLRDKYPSHNIHFSKTPDIVARDVTNKLVAAMECKKFWTSDEDKAYFKYHRGKVRQVDDRLTSPDPSENPFLWKLMCILCKAEDQVSSAEKQAGKGQPLSKFIFMNFSLDVSA